MWSDAARAKAVATKKRQARARKLAEKMSKPKRRKLERPTKKNYTGKYVKTAAWYADRLKRGMKVQTPGAETGAVLRQLVNTMEILPDTPTPNSAPNTARDMVLELVHMRLRGMSLVQLATVLERLD